MGKGITAKQYREAIRDAKGNITEASNALGVSRRAVYDAIAKYKTVKDEHEKWKETAVTEAEGRLFDAMRRDEQWAIQMILRHHKPEVYTEKKELHHDGKAFTINITPPSDD